MKEIRKDIVWYKWLYKVSNLWNIKSLSRKILNQWKHPFICNEKLFILRKNNHWYIQVTLTKNKKEKRVSVHRLVAQAFIKNDNNKPCINHKDWIRNNNVVNNLERCTKSENAIHARDYLWVKWWMLWLPTEKNPNCKKIVQMDLLWNNKKIWNSMKEIQKNTWMYWTWISACCRWIQKTSYWYKRKYL
jgi:hypothetical protein